MARDPAWEHVKQEERVEANELLEKYFMCRIYASYVGLHACLVVGRPGGWAAHRCAGRLLWSSANGHGTSAFHATDVDSNNDLVFSAHIAEVSKELTMDHESIQINPKFRAQAPWPLAQKGRSRTAHDAYGARHG